jgi:two-component system, NarL family, nitrate/nitrite response regulator NarL
MTQIRIVIADAQPLFRDGLARTIAADAGLRVVAALDDDAKAVATVRRLAPEVAVVDAGLRWTRVAEAIAQRRLGTRLMLLAAEVRPGEAFEAVAAGAQGYLSKQVDGAVVREAVRRVAAGGVALCEQAQTVVSREIRLRHRDERGLLAPRELEVLRLLAEGLSNGEIGSELHIAPATVKSHCTRIYQRLDARDRVGAVVEAMRRGLLD